MKSTVAKLTALLAAFLLLTACAPAEPTETTTEPTTQATTQATTAATTQPTTAPTTAPTTEATTAPTEPESTGNFTFDDIAYFQRMFTQPLFDQQFNSAPINYYNRVLCCKFSNPEQINLEYLFYESDDPQFSDSEMALLKENPKIEFALSVSRTSRETMDKVLRGLFGITLEETEGIGLDNLVYLEATDSYYNCHGSTNTVMCMITGGNWLDDGFVEVFYRNYSTEYVVTLHQDPMTLDFEIISNLPR